VQNARDVIFIFIFIGVIIMLAIHSGLAFLEVGTVLKKNQVNALVKIITDFGVSTITCFLLVIALLRTLTSFNLHHYSWKIDDVLGLWPLQGLYDE
jgi:hypothetical protein